ncbi:hypothetical protein TNCV_1233381 [Trichonephila clavipes]|nr:hypothetical protein TNCV_1233381 [Trichonephila clavipes]
MSYQRNSVPAIFGKHFILQLWLTLSIALELISLAPKNLLTWKQMDNSLHGFSTRYAITKALPTAEVDEMAKFLLEKLSQAWSSSE